MRRRDLARGYVRTQLATTRHRFEVARRLLRIARKLAWRALVHDLSKYRADEAMAFARTIDRMSATSYGSEAYRALLAGIRPAIYAHYTRNRHHPEYHAGGIADMGEVDRIEMLCDWAAAALRHDDGDLGASIEHNAQRFGYDEATAAQLRRIAADLGEAT